LKLNIRREEIHSNSSITVTIVEIIQSRSDK